MMISQDLVKNISAAADAHPVTVVAHLAGLPSRPRIARRIADALTRLGLQVTHARVEPIERR
jgi:predicted alpha/beta-hydrolase family hydrolase